MSPISWNFDGAFETNPIDHVPGRTNLDDHCPAPFSRIIYFPNEIVVA